MTTVEKWFHWIGLVIVLLGSIGFVAFGLHFTAISTNDIVLLLSGGLIIIGALGFLVVLRNVISDYISEL